MTAVLIDSNILLDVMTEDPSWFSWSAESLERAANSFRLVINPIIYAEVSIRYSKIEELNAPRLARPLGRQVRPYELPERSVRKTRPGSIG
jgi:hypothetical protein